jgi:hypothetical protein
MNKSTMRGSKMSDMHVLDRTGHSTVTWDPEKPIEVEVAKSMFKRLIEQGYNAFRVGEGIAIQGERIKEFDPQAGKIMMVPQLVGG